MFSYLEARYNEYLKQKEIQATTSDQSSIASFVSTGEQGQSYSAQNPRQKKLTDSLVNNLIISCALPISIVDHPNFRKFLSDSDPKYVPPSRQTVTYSILPKYLKEKKTPVAHPRSLTIYFS